ncbi:hypothetical protein FB45DRAFT_928058 [Roridomyces roridus]|uniref:Uncharacterized protein n=1 Tax=Roridomyces roridus TaxID=1738132 RepID=A0AAD7BHF0_9AGAR|nr:hypothetical protein FB45DRAFT_928058 [Roridomyces roridus]
MNPGGRLQHSDTFAHKGFAAASDGVAARRRPGSSFFNALLATALFRCWHILLFFAGWATMITVLDHHKFKVRIGVTLLTVVGTVLGFIVSYRTTSSFERYNEGRRLCRTFARTVWFHVGDRPATPEFDAETLKARNLVEKKTMINLLESFSVAVKHYLRGEDGIYYQDLYYLVKFLPTYALPPGIVSVSNADMGGADGGPLSPRLSDASANRPSLGNQNSFLYQRAPPASSMSAPHLPLPATASVPSSDRRPSFVSKVQSIPERATPPPLIITRPTMSQPFDEKHTVSGKLQSSRSLRSIRSPGMGPDPQKVILTRSDEAYLLPASMPPKYHLFDLFPFSLLVRSLAKRGREVKGKRAARLRAKMLMEKSGQGSGTHNLPLEITLYLSSYIAALQQRKQTDVPTTNTLLASLNQLVDALTGLERILTTPIPFSWPSQILATLGWVTIPATILLTFIFFGFLVAGEEIENPFGYDKNDLNLDHFTHNVVRNELRAITSASPPDPDYWAFSDENDMLFTADVEHDERTSPMEWVKRGNREMYRALSAV